jgi:CheY-like chemotaxis protein
MPEGLGAGGRWGSGVGGNTGGKNEGITVLKNRWSGFHYRLMTVPGGAADEPIHTLHLLMVEDRPEDFALVVQALGRGHLRLAPKRVDTEAGLVAALQQQLPDLVLCDHGGMAYDSFSALRRVRAVSPDVPFIVVTGRPGDALRGEALAQGADDWVSKNQLPDLLPAVRRALGLAQQRRQLRQLEREREMLRGELLAMRRAQRRRAIVPICASCKKIRNLQNEWVALEAYFDSDFGVRFSHGLCPGCASREYPGEDRPLGMG